MTVAAAPLRRDRDPPHAGQILPRDAFRCGNDLLQRPCRDNTAAMDTRTGADVHDKICRPHGILIVLDDDQGIAQVPQTL